MCGVSVGDEIKLKNSQVACINDVLFESEGKHIFSISIEKEVGTYVVYSYLYLDEQLKIAKIIREFSLKDSKYNLIEAKEDSLAYVILGCNRILEEKLCFFNKGRICIELIKEFRMLHLCGFAFDTVHLDCFVTNDNTGSVGIIAPEKLVQYGESLTKVFEEIRICDMAPELILKETLPDIYSDRYSMAVLLFKILFGVDPMIGKRVSDEIYFYPRRIWNKEWWVGDRLFIFDKTDASNYCTSGDVKQEWEKLAEGIKNCFQTSFSRDTQRENRVNEKEWINQFKQINELKQPDDCKKILNIVFIVANPKSMNGSKICALNNALEELIPEIIDIGESNADVEIEISIMSVSDCARWELFAKKVDENYRFSFLDVNDMDEINVLSAIDLLRRDFIAKFNDRKDVFQPIIFWFIDNKVTPDYEEALQLIERYKLFKNTIRCGIAVGDMSDKAFLRKISVNIVTVYTPEMLKKYIKISDLNEELVDEQIDYIEISYPEKEMIPVLNELGNDGRANHYLCLYKGKKMVYRELHNPIIPMKELFYETKFKIDCGKIPGEWPVACSEYDGEKFGYLHEYIPNTDKSHSFTTVKARILACKNVVKIYGVLHDRGFCFQHAAGFMNFITDYETGEMKIACADEILLIGKYHKIGRNSLETAPELYWNNRPSTVEGDRYSLAIFLFEILFDGHPLNGKKTMNAGLSEALIKELYLDNPTYVWNYMDDSNRPLKHQNNGLKAPCYIMDAFSFSFSKDVIYLLNGKKRITEREWFSLFRQWWNEMEG